ncbi:hypothetical protein PF005_g20475 [Phytophthora fragariae]|uniref:Uncharacterized protein n=1 Tax=Phytophthora fragariae TaxID=53985 RepID=A0A6A3QZY5_9STRA|nr:hypothetical protein PF009_g21161 [Phytophthora fragariae]KAE9086995.1 hypothetical protein PF007_g20544 [Phytophthora fragariae]KAE9115007.1 hypothetical protein PF006_g19375 [Phytophthora fragariae]KAE9187374.1 hypothetical protein PF005_g20475 [Phytophthora fragariae]
MLLPCLYAIYFRKALRVKPWIPLAKIHPRWQTSYDILAKMTAPPPTKLQKRKLIRAVDYCIQWLTAEARLRQISESIENILAATRVTSVCTNVSITSNQVAFFYELLAFRGSEWINDMCIRLAVDVMTQNRPEVRYVDASQVLS